MKWPQTVYNKDDILLYEVGPSKCVQVTKWSYSVDKVGSMGDVLDIKVGDTFSWSGLDKPGTVVKLEHHSKNCA